MGGGKKDLEDGYLLSLSEIFPFRLILWALHLSKKQKKNVEKYQWHAFQLGESH